MNSRIRCFLAVLLASASPIRAEEPVRPNILFILADDMGSSSTLRRGDWKLIYYHADRHFELFNLAQDLSEKHNLAANHPQRLREIAADLTRILQQHNAPMPMVKATGQPVPWPLATIPSQAGADRSPPRRNVLLLAVDDLRPELGCYGASHIASPRIDRLAASGVRFDRAYCQYAICGPSRASLLTGLRPDTLKIEHIDTYFRDTVPEVITLPQHFRAHGYTTVYTGKVFHAGQTDDACSWSRPAVQIGPRPGAAAGEYQLPESRAVVAQRRKEAVARFGPGTDLLGLACGPAVEAADAPDEAYPDGRITASALATLRAIKDQPFFLAVGWHKPHLPFVAPQRYFDLYDPRRLPLSPLHAPPRGAPTIALHRSLELRTRAGVPASGPMDEATSRWLMHGYAACVSFIDAQVGRVLDELDALGLTDRTIVVLWGDHGWHLGEYGIWGKATNYEVATRVPLIVAAPGARGNGRGTRALAEFVDLYPTLCELAGLPRPGHLEGTSLAPVLQHPTATVKTAALSQFPAPALREWAARPLSPAMRQTFFGPLMEDTEAALAREHGDRWAPALFAEHLMGYSLRTDRHRLTVWVDRRHPEAEPYAVELYDHECDPHETVNLANRPEQQSTLAALRRRLDEANGN